MQILASDEDDGATESAKPRASSNVEVKRASFTLAMHPFGFFFPLILGSVFRNFL